MMFDGYVKFEDGNAIISGVQYGSRHPSVAPILAHNEEEHIFAVKFPGHPSYINAMTGTKYSESTIYVFRYRLDLIESAGPNGYEAVEELVLTKLMEFPVRPKKAVQNIP